MAFRLVGVWLLYSLVFLIPCFVTGLFIELHGTAIGVVGSALFMGAVFTTLALYFVRTDDEPDND